MEPDFNIFSCHIIVHGEEVKECYSNGQTLDAFK